MPARPKQHPRCAHCTRKLAVTDARIGGQLLARDALSPGSRLLTEARSDHGAWRRRWTSHPRALLRARAAPRSYPREALFTAIAWWVVGK